MGIELIRVEVVLLLGMVNGRGEGIGGLEHIIFWR